MVFFIVYYLNNFSAGFKKIIALLWGPLFVGAPVRPHILNMPKSASDQDYQMWTGERYITTRRKLFLDPSHSQTKMPILQNRVNSR